MRHDANCAARLRSGFSPWVGPLGRLQWLDQSPRGTSGEQPAREAEVADDDTRLVAAPFPRDHPTRTLHPRQPRQQQLYDLQPGDPDELGPFRCIHRLKPGAEPINDDKPTPLLGTTSGPTSDGGPDFVVIKVLTGEPTADGRTRLREEQAWSHQQRVFRGSGAEPDFSWVAREFYQGVSLDQLVGQPEWTRERSTTAARMILVGIAQVHHRREIHCDIKPANVIVHDRRATLIDFESSRDGVEQRPRVVEATKAYASPEQLFGGGTDRPILQINFVIEAIDLDVNTEATAARRPAYT